MKGAAHCSFRRGLLNSYFGKAMLMNFVSNWIKLFKHCTSVEFCAGGRLCTGYFTKGAAHCSSHKVL